MSDSQNPYLAPESVAETAPPPTGPTRRPGLWTVLFLLNLIVPLFFGFQCVDGWSGVLGMFVAIAIFYAATVFIAERRRSLYTPGCIGAVFVALMQFYPVLQMYSGLLALTVTGWFFGQSKPGQIGPAASGLTTIITGLLLLAVVMAFGEVCRFVRSLFTRRR